MIYLFILILLLFLCFLVHKLNYDIVKPQIIIVSTFIAAAVFSASYTTTWNLPMQVDTMLLLLFFISVFIAGSFLADSTNISNGLEIRDSNFKVPTYDIKWKYFAGIMLVGILLVYFNYLELSDIAAKYTKSTLLSQKLAVIVRKFHEDVEHFSKFYSIRGHLLRGITYISLYAFICNVINKTSKEKIIKFLFPSLLIFPFILFSGGRQGFIVFAIYGFTVFVFLYQIHYGFTMTSVSKLLKILVVVLGIFAVLFFGVGALNGKIRNNNSNPIRVFSHYGGTNLNAFDVFLHKTYPDNKYPGSTTLTGIYNKLHILNSDVPKFRMYITEFTEFDGITTNVYTAFRRYVQDFGIVGCTIVSFLYGLFFTMFYNHIKYHSLHKLPLIILYGIFIYPICMLFREERFMNEFLTVGLVVKVIIMMSFYYLLNKINRKEEVNANE